MDFTDDGLEPSLTIPALREQDIYRFYDADGVLLYLGISVNAAMRSQGHRAGSEWWPAAVRMEIDHLGLMDRAAAELIERSCIQVERPMFNVVHNNSLDVPEEDVPVYEVVVRRPRARVVSALWELPLHPPEGLPLPTFERHLVSINDAAVELYGDKRAHHQLSVRALLPVLVEGNRRVECVARNQLDFVKEWMADGGPARRAMQAITDAVGDWHTTEA